MELFNFSHRQHCINISIKHDAMNQTVQVLKIQSDFWEAHILNSESKVQSIIGQFNFNKQNINVIWHHILVHFLIPGIPEF